MAEYRFTIPGRLPGLNDYVRACRAHRMKAAQLIEASENLIIWAYRKALQGTKLRPPVTIAYRFFEPDRRRDHDNISGYAHKVVQDALVKAGALPNDGWNEILNDTNNYAVDKKDPRIEIIITEVPR